ncbi:hypothetical protein FB451DRAFT_1362907 [Mycena latifolia]|nr:hypothetical protein FB451DRAFT_1362907 [Mycena latifolia]
MIIPPELIDAIVHQVEDVDSLKACSLAGSWFRATSQRVLLSSLTLDTHSHTGTYAAACTMLAESPHVAAYIKRFTVELSEGTSHVEGQNLQRILRKLTNVRRCTIAGDSQFCCWGNLTAAPTIIGFIRKQPLEELHVLLLNGVPLPVLAVLISSAPTLSFFTVHPNRWIMLPPGGRPTGSPMKQLLLSRRSNGICDMLSRPECARYLVNVRELGLCPHPEYTNEIISSCAQTLEHLRFNCTQINTASIILPLPPLTALRSIEIMIAFTDFYELWLIRGISSLLASGPPTLEEITVTYSPISRMVPPPYVLRPETINELGKALIDFMSSVRIRWRLDFESDEAGQHLHVAAFARSMQRGLPETYERGKLVVERYCINEQLHHWAIR